ncbi:hypothetical protein FNF27_04554 [Cafeteria roenbergensis]|uniref:Uncharacterized protein n=1 Tax=Cafeteria roenbergensis TaxID=33653 RepID=A0A5A8DBU8_CAFRO|nr:hypothetical protein FNF28_04442 [Cafeteria roenbergensis]KAA0173993.1 hypothetical protein FNF27_04554 [Cafeteria roenbergensis]
MAARPTHRARADAPRSSVDQDKLQAFMNRARDVVHRSVERNKLASLARVVDEAGDGPSREITVSRPAEDPSEQRGHPLIRKVAGIFRRGGGASAPRGASGTIFSRRDVEGGDGQPSAERSHRREGADITKTMRRRGSESG